MSLPKKLLIVALVLSSLYGLFCGLLWFKTGHSPLTTTHLMLCEARKRSGIPCSLVDDLDRMCAVMTDGNARSFGSGEEKSRWLTDRMSNSIRTNEGLKLFMAIGMAPLDQKMKLVLDAAEKHGAPAWDCPAFRATWPTTPPNAE